MALWVKIWYNDKPCKEKEGRNCYEDKTDLIKYCLTYKDVYEDYPSATMSGQSYATGTIKVFAWIYARNQEVCINLEMLPEWIEFWRRTYEGVRPGYHLNKKH